MGRSEDCLATNEKALGGRDVGERIVAVGQLGIVGAAKSSNLMAFPFATWVIRRRGRRKAPGFPLLTEVAVTPSRLVFFGFEAAGWNRVAELARDEWRVDVVAPRSRRGLPQVALSRADGSRLEFELRQAGRCGEVNNAFMAELESQTTDRP